MVDFAGVVVAAILAFLAGWLSTRIQVNSQVKLARDAQQETRRTQRHEYMIWLMHQMVDARTRYEGFLGEGKQFTDDDLNEHQQARRELGEIVGKAIAVCLASGDESLRIIAEDQVNGLTPYLVGNFRDRNRAAFHQAVNRLGVIVRELSGVDEIASPKHGIWSRLASR